VWRPAFACPDCRRPVNEADGVLACQSCGVRFERRDGIYCFLTSARRTATEPFRKQYHVIRETDGYRSGVPDYYRMLPMVARDDPRSAEWRIRRESYAHLQQHALPAMWLGPVRVLDVGAGNGWLSHRLAAFGHHTVAVDLLDDPLDGLGACRYYPVAFTAVQADFDALPFEASQFNVVVLNGSLHYAPKPERTLGEARRMLAPGGALVVMDSPMFKSERDGQSMVDSQLQTMSAQHGLGQVVRPGVGFLTYEGLNRTASDLGLSGRFVRSSGPLVWRWRRRAARLRLRRAPAAFGVWVAR
jgi:ubiquinone/menaquinone biosynthesis C-methylase UbiE